MQGRVGALDLDENALRVVDDPTGQRQIGRQAVDERPEADALHCAVDLDAQAVQRSRVCRLHVHLARTSDNLQPSNVPTCVTCHQPRHPVIHARARLARDDEQRRVGVDHLHAAAEEVQVELEDRRHVGLVQQHNVGRGEHAGILVRLVVALRRAGDHHCQIGAQIELGRAHQIADVLDEEQIDVRQRQLAAARRGSSARRGGSCRPC